VRSGLRIGLAGATVATGAVVALAAGHAAARPAPVAHAACADRGWAAIASGGLAQPLPASGTNYALSHAHRRWRLTLRGAPGTVLSGHVTSDHGIRLVHRRSWAHRQGRTITFNLQGSGHTRHLAFRTRCAKRLTVAFDGGGTQSVVLGSGQPAPTPTLILARPPITGVDGKVIRGPGCPVVGGPTNCPQFAQPAPGDIRIDTAPASKGDQSAFVKTITTDDQGHFTTDLPAGRYMFTPQQGARSRSTEVDVADGVVSDVILAVDTGIR
jgi:hypothetical protein